MKLKRITDYIISLVIGFVPPYDQYAKNLYTLGYVDGARNERQRIFKEIKKLEKSNIINIDEMGFSKRLQAKGI